jgi:RNA polymerase sigma-70 factor (ECF subfamily)
VRSTPSLAAAVLLLAGWSAACKRPASAPPELEVSTTPARAATGTAGPRVLAFDPPQGATGVDPARTTLAVTFDREMDPEGWAWVIENEATAPEVGESSWDATTRTNTVAVRLAPGRRYVLWINSPQYPYFRDRTGARTEPIRWTFATAGTPQPAAQPVAAHAPSAAGSPPAIATLEPPAGATDVDPALAALRVTFDRPMQEGWSWVTEGSGFPPSAGAATMSADRRQAMLPVRLEPGRSYVVWLNSETYQGFRDERGTPLAPFRWTFSTRGSP